MHSLVIAEKPSAAAKIAEALADKKPVKKIENKIPYYELTHKGKKIFIGSAVGHLFGLTEEKKSGLKYPVFDIVWKPAYQTSKTAGYTKDYIELLKKLSSGADSFYNGCDVDIEGELIFRNALRFICGKEDANRMYFSTLTKDELIDAFEHAKPHIDFGLAEAGEARHFMDHYWGISVSRALMSAIKAAGTFKIMSSGRVQGPTLKILAEREREISAFKPVPYWQVFLYTKLKNKNVIAVHKEEKFWEEQKADQVMHNTEKKDNAFVESIERKEFSQEPPHPFDLTAMQLEAYKTLKITPKETLAITQELYIAGYISYPRTSSDQLPQSLNYKKIITSISKQKEYSDICNGLLKKSDLKPNNGKKTDPAHPAVYPTGEIPKNLKGRSFLLYDLIVRRTLASFGESAIRESATVVIDVNNEDFILRGAITKFPGWHEIYGRYVMLKEEEIPNVKEKEKIKVDDIVKESKETQPPKRYTPASIIKELEKRNLGTKSLSGDTLVYINGKWISIKALFVHGEKTSEELLVKIPIASFYNLNNKKLEIKKHILVAKRFKAANEKIFSIETYFTRLLSDSQHKFFLIDPNGIVYEKEASSLNIGDRLLFTKLNSFGAELITREWLGSSHRKYSLLEKKGYLQYQNGVGFELSSLPILESGKLFWLLGYIYGDGHIEKRYEYEGYKIGITIDKNEDFLIKKIIKTVEDLFGNGCYGITVPSKTNIIRINIPSVISYYLVKRFPTLSSKAVFDIPKEYMADFVKGYMDSDGNIHLRGKKEVLINKIPTHSNNTPRIKFVLSRKEHILWIKEILKRLGITTTAIKENIARIGTKEYSCYEFKISGKNNILLYAIYVGFEHHKKRNLLYEGLINNSKQYTPIRKLITCISTLLKNNNRFTKFGDRLTYILRAYEKIGILERKRICVGYSRKYYVRISSGLVTKLSNFLLSFYAKEVIPWVYALNVSSVGLFDYKEEELYDLIVDKENPTFITLGGQVVHNSTRAEIIDSLYKRNYVRDDSLEVTDLGIKTIETLEKYSPYILNEKLTRHFEKEMNEIQEGKKNKEEVLKEAEKVLTKILKQFKENEEKIGKELAAANIETRNKDSIVGKCLKCSKDLRVLFSRRFKSYFVACSGYPDCKTTYSLPQGLPKPSDKKCKECSFIMVTIIRKGRRPYDYCINKECPAKVKWREEQAKKKLETKE